MKMVFTCDNCGFIFSRTAETEQCPDCGKFSVRPATEDERIQYTRQMADISPPPDLVEINIEVIDYFRFKLPAVAFGVDSRQIVEVLVEHGVSIEDKTMVHANVWARLPGGEYSNFLMPINVPLVEPETSQDRAGRIVAALNDSSFFSQKMTEFFLHLSLDEGNG